ncbi:FecR protein [Nitrosomonas sp. Nm51]|uniref:FecR domain-containing protein n=1 Tax=Nitrosomonas sp. Nm51 TaxID=133720 RepID=UPI0008CB911C|nr:FecR family protein [Nitrosomonas sp. Nm51]SER15108.1 FecR protein [Nitrosomonas sp. Nm51]
MPQKKDSDSNSKDIKLTWRQLLFHFVLLCLCVLLGVFSWYLSRPQSIRLHETGMHEYLTVSLTPEIEVSLDHGSSCAVTDYEPLRIELFRGNAYFNIKKKQADDFRVKVGEAFIEDLGTRFSVRMRKDGNHIVSVGQGQIKVHVADGEYLISALEQANFNNFKISKHRMISANEVAPWDSQQIVP